MENDNQEIKPQRNKLLSGRLWLTSIAGLVFMAFSVTVCLILWENKKTITSSEVSSIMNMLLLIISNITTFYFTKNRDDGTGYNRRGIANAINSLSKELVSEETK